MKAVAVAAVLALLTVAPAVAQSTAAKPKAGPVSKPEPKTRANPCAQHGAGFVQVEGTGACVQVRGYLRMQGSTR